MKYFLFTALLWAAGLSGLRAQVTDTTALYQRDSAVEQAPDPTTLFFQQGEKLTNTRAVTLVLRNGKIQRLEQLLKSEDYQFGDHVLSDLDGDRQPELLLYRYTGGAHCCDEITLFRKAGNRYQFAGVLFAGHTVIEEDKSFIYSLHESFGYFFTCYACGLEDTTIAAPLDPSHLMVRYQKGKLAVVPGDAELKRYLLDNLSKLREMAYPPLDDEPAGMDEGFRKAFALNLAVYYYSFGKNMAAVQQLFRRYYTFPDAARVWKAFRQNLVNVGKQNSF